MADTDERGAQGVSGRDGLIASTFAIAQTLLPQLTANRGTLVALGGIAAVRGRSRNVIYAAAKRGLESFCESLRQGHEPQAPSVQCWRLGFVATNLTYGVTCSERPPRRIARRSDGPGSVPYWMETRSRFTWGAWMPVSASYNARPIRSHASTACCCSAGSNASSCRPSKAASP